MSEQVEIIQTQINRKREEFEKVNIIPHLVYWGGGVMIFSVFLFIFSPKILLVLGALISMAGYMVSFAGSGMIKQDEDHKSALEKEIKELEETLTAKRN